MAKDYSADALIQADVNRQLANQKSKPVEQKPQVEVPRGLPNIRGSQPPQPADNFVLTPKDMGQVLPDVDDWDYKTATVDLQGNPLQKRTFLGLDLKPQSFDPFGNPYFGGGVTGWMKKWAYKLSEEEATKDEANKAWDEFWTTAEQIKAESTPADNVFGEEQLQKNRTQTGLFIKGVQQLFEAVTKSGEASEIGSNPASRALGFDSPLTPILRGVNAAVGMTLEMFQTISELPEKAMSVNRAMREYSTQAGSLLPDLDVDATPEYIGALEENRPIYVKADETVQARTDLVNFGTRLFNPLLVAYDSVRFWSSPGSFKDKTEAISLGWAEGRMLYTELIKPTVRAEFQQRLQAGEDPNLLAMELEDPWIELGGEILLDPSILLGAVGKAKKAGSTILEATQITEKSGLLTNADFVNPIKRIVSASTEAQASQIMDEVVPLIKNYASETSRRIDSLNNFKLTSLTSEGNKIRQTRTVSNYLANIVQSTKNFGGSPEEALQFVHALALRASGDANDIKKSISILSKSNMQMLAYNQHAFDVGHIMNSLMGDGDSLVKAIKSTNGSWDDLRKVLDTKVQKSLDYMFPSLDEMVKAQSKVDELKALGQVPDKKTQGLADKLSELQKTESGAVAWSKTQLALSKSVRGISSFLANNYFSLSYGYATRNFIQNMFSIWVDGGFKFSKENAIEFTKQGIKTPKLDAMLTKWFGDIPPALKGKTFRESVTEGSFLSKQFDWLNKLGYSPAALADAAEVYAGKMIYVKKFRETMDTALTLGGGLPDVASWEKAGFLQSQADDFVELMKLNDYDVAQTVNQFNKKYSTDFVDKWRVMDWVNPEVKKGISENEDYWQRILSIANNDEATPTQLIDEIDNIIVEVRKKANRTASEPVRIDQSDPMWKGLAEERKIKGFREELENRQLALKLKFDEAAYNLNQGLQNAATKLPPEALQLKNEIASFTDYNNIKVINEQVETQVSELRSWMITTVRDNKTPIDKLWDESILGKKPTFVDKQTLNDKVMEYFYNKKGSIYEKKWKAYIDKAQELAKLTGLQDEFAQANKSLVQLEQFRDYIYNKRGIYTKPPDIKDAPIGSSGNANNIRSIANSYGIASKAESGANLDKQLLNIINKYSGGEYARLDDIPIQDAEKALANNRGFDPIGFAKHNADGSFVNLEKTEGVPVVPPRDPSVSPIGHVDVENQEGLIDALRSVRNGVVERQWLKISSRGNPEGLKSLTSDLAERITFAKSRSQIVAEKYRDFALLPYGETTNLDLALSLVYPYQFWYSRSYKNWMQRAFMTNPEIISRYANLKEALANEQKGLPDWWKSQINVNKLFGIESDNPIYVNLEATVWPLYGLTGVDFNDPVKRTNWFTSTIDDMGKFGPSMFAPIQWAIATYYYGQGEKEISSRWGSRMLPVTQTIKAFTSLVGNPIELDPNVQIFSGDAYKSLQASDPYEEGRISRALASMESEGNYTQEQLLEAARTHEGDIWNEAYIRANQGRAGGNIMSFLFGTGFKTRTQEDIETDKFYSDYGRLQNLHDGDFITDEQYKQGFNELREKYPFMDIILLSRRAGVGRDAAYAYNVISRIPPGASRDMYEIVGLDPETVQNFYDSGGKFEGMNETEISRFMASMIDMGAILAIPSNSTRREWTSAKNTYSQMQFELQRKYGDDILEQISLYYGIDDVDKSRDFLEANPEIEMALDDQNSYIVNSPILSKYYGGLDTLERYYKAQMYDELESQFGEDITDLESQYYSIYDPAQRRAFLKSNPVLKSYWDKKDELKRDVLEKVVEFGRYLDEPEFTGTGNEPENPVQEDIAEFIQPTPRISFGEWQQLLGNDMTSLIAESWYSGEDIPNTITNGLDFIAPQYGFQDADEMLQEILMSLP